MTNRKVWETVLNSRGKASECKDLSFQLGKSQGNTSRGGLWEQLPVETGKKEEEEAAERAQRAQKRNERTGAPKKIAEVASRFRRYSP